MQLWTSKNFKDAINISWGPPNFTADGWLYPFYSSQGGANYNGVNDPDLDKLLDQQRKELDANKRKEIIKQIDVRLHDQNYDVFYPRQLGSSDVGDAGQEFPQPWLHGAQPVLPGERVLAGLDR